MAPRAKPIEQHKREGTYRPDKHGDRPNSIAGVPPVPENLPERAHKYWHRMCSTLSEMGVISQEDAYAIALYARSEANLALSESQIQEHGFYVPSTKGTMTVNPAVTANMRASAQLESSLKLLGLTPLLKSQIKKPPKPQERGAHVPKGGRRKKDKPQEPVNILTFDAEE